MRDVTDITAFTVECTIFAKPKYSVPGKFVGQTFLLAVRPPGANFIKLVSTQNLLSAKYVCLASYRLPAKVS